MRHCVFVLGAAGSAKSEVWKTLAARRRPTSNIGTAARRPTARSTRRRSPPTSSTATSTRRPRSSTTASSPRSCATSPSPAAQRAQVGRPRRRHRRRVDRVDEHRDGRQQGAHARLQRAHPAHAVDAAALRDLAPAQRLARDRLARRRALPQRDRRRLAALCPVVGRRARGAPTHIDTKETAWLEQLFNQYVRRRSTTIGARTSGST